MTDLEKLELALHRVADRINTVDPRNPNYNISRAFTLLTEELARLSTYAGSRPPA